MANVKERWSGICTRGTVKVGGYNVEYFLRRYPLDCSGLLLERSWGANETSDLGVIRGYIKVLYGTKYSEMFMQLLHEHMVILSMSDSIKVILENSSLSYLDWEAEIVKLKDVRLGLGK